MQKNNRENAFRVLSCILWERKFKKQLTINVNNGGRMLESEFEKYSEIAKTIKK